MYAWVREGRGITETGAAEGAQGGVAIDREVTCASGHVIQGCDETCDETCGL